MSKPTVNGIVIRSLGSGNSPPRVVFRSLSGYPLSGNSHSAPRASLLLATKASKSILPRIHELSQFSSSLIALVAKLSLACRPLSRCAGTPVIGIPITETPNIPSLGVLLSPLRSPP